MLYRIKLDDNSFIIANDDYELTLFKHAKKKKVSVKDYLANNKLRKYHLLDNVDNKQVKRYFIIEPLENQTEESLGIKVGSRVKFAIDIQKDDLVLGSDGKPRRVKELHTGEDDMYDIAIGNNTYTVNGGHILALVDKDTGEHLEMPVNIFMHMDDEFKSHYAMEMEEFTNGR